MARHKVEICGVNTANLKVLNNEEMIVFVVLAAGVIIIVLLCLRHLRKKAEDHKELTNKLIENNLLNSTETISKETIEALMNPKPKKSEKDKLIADATLLGLGLGLGFGSKKLNMGLSDSMEVAAYVLYFYGAIRIIIRTISIIVAYFISKKKTSNTSIKVEEAEIVEEK